MFIFEYAFFPPYSKNIQNSNINLRALVGLQINNCMCTYACVHDCVCTYGMYVCARNCACVHTYTRLMSLSAVCTVYIRDNALRA